MPSLSWKELATTAESETVRQQDLSTLLDHPSRAGSQGTRIAALWCWSTQRRKTPQQLEAVLDRCLGRGGAAPAPRHEPPLGGTPVSWDSVVDA
jgi:hypothetical protein